MSSVEHAEASSPTPAVRAGSSLSAADLAKHLCAALDEDPGDGSRFRVALGEIARDRGMMKLSRDTGLAREALYRALSEKGNPELATVLRVLKALGLQMSVRPRAARRRSA